MNQGGRHEHHRHHHHGSFSRYLFRINRNRILENALGLDDRQGEDLIETHMTKHKRKVQERIARLEGYAQVERWITGILVVVLGLLGLFSCM